MTTPNHLAGGLVFTGTMLSFYNVNLFEKPLYVGACLLCSLIPDIDSPKTVSGRLVYPLAVAINRKFGHRTFTHSLTFLGLIWLFWSFLARIFDFNTIYVQIFIFAFLSHIILDMLTIQGVPLFYPFRRNPCVLPANPEYRLNTSKPKSELIVFTIFILLGFTMFPLFSQGFWTTYNRNFGTVSHCDRENKNSCNWVICEYSYMKNNAEYNGEGFILESNKKELELFNGNKVFKLSTDDRALTVKAAKPKGSGIPKRFNELSFMNIPLDSVNVLMNKRVCSGMLQSNYNVQYVDKGITYHTNFLKFANSYDFKVLTAIDTAKFELHKKLLSVNARIEKDSLRQLEKNHTYYKLLGKKMRLTDQITNLSDDDLYLKNKLQSELIEVSRKVKSYSVKNLNIDIVLLRERESILEELEKENPLLFSGFITYCIFDKPNKN